MPGRPVSRRKPCGTQNKHRPEVRTPKGRPEGGRREPAPTRSRESDDRIRAMTSGNGWHPDPAEQRRSVPEESFGREPCPSTDKEKHVTWTFEGSGASEERTGGPVQLAGASPR